MRTNKFPPIQGPAVPKVSVCIPTYCGGLTIGAAIESVLAQSLTDFELIVIDDGSNDNTRAVVESFSDPRLQYFQNAKNLGPQKNWNRCLELARDEYFKLLPHDNLLHPQCLAHTLCFDNPTIPILYSLPKQQHLSGNDGELRSKLRSKNA